MTCRVTGSADNFAEIEDERHHRLVVVHRARHLRIILRRQVRRSATKCIQQGVIRANGSFRIRWLGAAA